MLCTAPRALVLGRQVVPNPPHTGEGTAGAFPLTPELVSSHRELASIARAELERVPVGLTALEITLGFERWT